MLFFFFFLSCTLLATSGRFIRDAFLRYTFHQVLSTCSRSFSLFHALAEFSLEQMIVGLFRCAQTLGSRT